jgi:hypothetical protein
MAGTVWTGLVLWAVLSLWLRMLRKEREWTMLRWMLAALLLGVSGLDLLPFLVSVSHRLFIHDPHWIPYATLDWWSFDQVTNWIDILLWVPHCAAAFAACATGLLILVGCAHRDLKHRAITIAIAGACFASSVGLSIYVAFGFVVFCAGYAVFLAFRQKLERCPGVRDGGCYRSVTRCSIHFGVENPCSRPGVFALRIAIPSCDDRENFESYGPRCKSYAVRCIGSYHAVLRVWLFRCGVLVLVAKTASPHIPRASLDFDFVCSHATGDYKYYAC